MTIETTNAYLKSKVMSATPAELRLLLIDGAIKFARQGREGLATSDFEQVYNGLSQSKSIILELLNGLRPDIDPELCGRLSGLYTYMYRRLLDASMDKQPEIVDEVISLLEYDRETWIMLMDRVAEEETDASVAQPAPAPEHAGLPADGPRPTISVEG